MVTIKARNRTDLNMFIRLADPFQSAWAARNWSPLNRPRITVAECPEWMGEEFDLS